MTAHSSGAKRRIVVRRKTQRGSSSTRKYVPPKLPKKPKVTNVKCYGRSKSGGFIVPRFFITQFWFRSKPKESDPWFVVDLETANVASGTKKAGYHSKDKAIVVARRYRDEFGAWHVMPF